MENVLIVGAGPVGLMLACELSLAGARPIVLDKRPEISGVPKANGLVGQIVETLDHRGLLERFGAGSPFVGRAPGFPFGGVPLRLQGVPGVPLRMMLIQQPRLERLLTERALELGAEIRRGCELLGLAQDEDGVTLTTGQGELRARYAVGCDGARSLVRAAAGIGFPGTTDTEHLLLGHFKTDVNLMEAPAPEGARPGWDRRVLLTSLQPGVLIAAVRRPGAPPEGPVTLEAFQEALRAELGCELPLGEPIWLSSTVAQARLAERYRAGRVFLAGDAAHLFPAGGSALNVGLTDAVNLGWKLAAVLAGRVPEELLDTYEPERRAAGARTLVQTRAQAAIDRAPAEYGTALRELLGEVFALEEPARHLAGLLYDSGVRYDPGHPGAHPLAGRFVPDLGLADGRPVAELLRAGRPVLLDLGGGTDGVPEDGWIDVVRSATAGDAAIGDAAIGDGAGEPPADVLLIRPDGYVAWAGAGGLAEAAGRWFGAVTTSRA
ncbi:FAD-dependent monooxygenase [Nonomuraea sp. NPDC050783]|uniref:FAD-dependent monooxygenase n=1 Tax=Nonomuraea sp. NPDC050783 TaxID=3154634 RepID=UPI00346621E2